MYSLHHTKFSISLRGPKSWNDVLYQEEKNIRPYSFFQNKLKSKLLQTESETKYFWNCCNYLLIQKLQSNW